MESQAPEDWPWSAAVKLFSGKQNCPGAVFTRVASSHIRVGTFELFASRRDNESVKILADYAIDRHYPQLKGASNPYIALLEKSAKCRHILSLNGWGLDLSWRDEY